MSHRWKAAARLLWAVALGACTVEIPGGLSPGGGSGGGGGGSGSGPSGSAEGKLSNNGLVLDIEALALLEPEPIGRWVDGEGGEAIADGPALAELLDHPAGLEHAEYLALCALPEGAGLTVAAADGSTVSYPGLLGLAPGWVTGACDLSCQRWVSACVLAHANAYDLSVTMSLRGDHPALTWSDEIADQYTVQEAAFYGNVFELAGASSAAPPLYACGGRALMSTSEDGEPETDHSIEYLTQRICGTSTQCGFNQTGPCHFSIAAGSACKRDAGPRGSYGDCVGDDLEDPLAPPPVFPEAITTYLAP